MGVGWALNQIVYPGSITGAGAIISTIPVFAVIGFVIIVVIFRSDNVYCCAGSCTIILLLFAGVFECIGGILFIVAGVQAGDARVLAYGVSAGVFGILAGFSCCGSISAYATVCGDKKGGDESSE